MWLFVHFTAMNDVSYWATEIIQKFFCRHFGCYARFVIIRTKGGRKIEKQQRKTDEISFWCHFFRIHRPNFAFMHTHKKKCIRICPRNTWHFGIETDDAVYQSQLRFVVVAVAYFKLMLIWFPRSKQMQWENSGELVINENCNSEIKSIWDGGQLRRGKLFCVGIIMER